MTHLPALAVDHINSVPIRLAFRLSVAHSLASRSFSDNVCTVIRSDDGLCGFGECIPRDYVTGENLDTVMSALEFFTAESAGMVFEAPDNLIRFLSDLGETSIADRNPSALCSLELALLDLAGKHWNLSLARLIGFHETIDRLRYSMVVPLIPLESYPVFLEQARLYGFGHVKVKVGSSNTGKRVRAVRDALGPGIEIRIDANSSWNRENAPGIFHEMADLGVTAIEQPLAADDLEGMADLRRISDIPIVLDESIHSRRDVERAASIGACDIVNIRISKCGGILGSLKVIGTATEHGLRTQLGAQVGESCILSAAGACLAKGTPSFLWLEGCFGKHLLCDDLCTSDFRFGPGGLITPPDAPGLGVPVDHHLIDDAHLCFTEEAAS